MIVFFLILMMPGREPLHFEREVESLGACLYEAHEFLAHPSHEILISGGFIQVGCIRELPKSVEH